METIVLRISDPMSSKKDERFLLGLQFSRLYNALNAALRSYVALKTDSPADKRDRIERVLSHGAIVAECLSTLEKHHTDLEGLPCWSSTEPRIVFVQSQLREPSSFYRTVLKTIRDKIMYHYDLSVIQDVIQDYPLHDGIRFGEAESTSGIDLCFPLVDEMIIHYLIKRYGPDKPEMEVYESIMDGLIDCFNGLLWTLKEIITDLIASQMEWRSPSVGR